MWFIRVVLLLAFFFKLSPVIGADKKIVDSLLLSLKSAKDDSVRIATYVKLSISSDNANDKLRYLHEASRLTKLNNKHRLTGLVSYYISRFHENNGNRDSCVYYLNSMRHYGGLAKDKALIGYYLMTIAYIKTVYFKDMEYAEYYLDTAITIYRDIYDNQHKNGSQYAQALWRKAESIQNKLGEKQIDVNKYKKELSEIRRLLALAFVIKDEKGQAIVDYDSAISDAFLNYYILTDELDSSLIYAKKALETNLKGGTDFPRIAYSYARISQVYQLKKDYGKALEATLKGIECAKEHGLYKELMDNYEALRNLYYEKGDYRKAHDVLKWMTRYNDSINSKSALNAEELFKSELKAEKLQQESLYQKESMEMQKTITYLMISVLFLVLVFSVLMAWRWRKSILQNKIIERQKAIVDQKNIEITESINYAKRIQQAKLPSLEVIKSALQHSFVLFKPKDIVSGDFYYFREKDGCIFLAVADCTGHGVPGAIMAMLGSERLDDAINQSSHTGEILQLLNAGIKTSLKQSEHDAATRDGMDIALCKIEKSNGRISFSGANRSLWIIRNGANEIEDHKSTKAAIGGFTSDQQLFQEIEIKVLPGDTVYLSTDGYADTFGGVKEKKLTTKRFKELLVSINMKSMQEQEEFLNTYIEAWRGGIEQIDDILVIGFKL